VVSDLGEVPVPDIVPEMADFLLRLKDARWTCVLGSVGERLFISLRAGDARLRADRTLKRSLKGLGASGGHGSMAGGQVPLAGLAAEQRAALRQEFVIRFLQSVRVKDRAGHLLVEDGPPPR
jgi:nanoRNase/pAp phosphatase (c-di-AMP/oligoRNAs hydrolase)